MLRRGSKNIGWAVLGIVLGVFLASQIFAQAQPRQVRIPPKVTREFTLKVTREVVRHDNWYQVILNLTNKGSKDISNIVVADSNAGFQCTDDSPVGASVNLYSPPCQIQIRNDVHGRWSLMEISPEWTLKPEQKMVVTYPIVPVMYSKRPFLFFKHTVGKQLTITYMDHPNQRQPHSVEFPNLAEDGPDVGNAFRSADYLIVTVPSLLFDHNPGKEKEVNKLLATMAKLAKAKKGVLGYGASLTHTGLRNLIAPGGFWNKRLCPGWSQSGYLLLVGEKDIIPHWPTINAIKDRPIIMSDHFYADISGDWRPELKVGRIIGNTASNLIIPIEQSLAVLSGVAENDGSHAYFISGHKESARFQLDVNSGAQYLHDNKQVWVTELHMGGVSKGSVQLSLKNNLPGSDYVFYCGHGVAEGWDYFGAGDVCSANITSKKTRPIVFTVACHTGEYVYTDEQGNLCDGIARAFLRCGAGAYVGGTVMLNVTDNTRHIRNYGLLKYYNKGRRIGDILKDWKINLDIPNLHKGNDLRLLYAMNLYGDPKFGGD